MGLINEIPRNPNGSLFFEGTSLYYRKFKFGKKQQIYLVEVFVSIEQYGAVYLVDSNTKWRGKELVDRVDYLGSMVQIVLKY